MSCEAAEVTQDAEVQPLQLGGLLARLLRSLEICVLLRWSTHCSSGLLASAEVTRDLCAAEVQPLQLGMS